MKFNGIPFNLTEKILKRLILALARQLHLIQIMEKEKNARDAAGAAVNSVKEKIRRRRQYGEKEKKTESWLGAVLRKFNPSPKTS